MADLALQRTNVKARCNAFSVMCVYKGLFQCREPLSPVLCVYGCSRKGDGFQ